MPSTMKKLATFAAATLLAIVASALASGTSAAATVRPTIQGATVGTWDGTVQHAGGGGAVTFTFRADGLACLASSDGGGVGGDGVGVWLATGTSTFTYRMLERLHDGNGLTTGYVDVNQNAVVSANAIHSTGISRIYDPNGVFIASAAATVDLARSVGTAAVC